MALFAFRRDPRPTPLRADPQVGALLLGSSIEVTPRTAANVPDFRTMLPAGTRIYIAHIDGTDPAAMIATARRLTDEGFAPMPHIPARSMESHAMLADLVARYRSEAGVSQALLLGGGAAMARGPFLSSMQLIETGLFDGFTDLHVAGHPEGNRDIDPDGSDRVVTEALQWKQRFADRSDSKMAITTQFCFEAGPVIDWAARLSAAGVRLPIHLGVAGPTKLQTLLKYAIACGVGPSLRVLQRRAMDVSRLLLPHEPTEFLTAIAQDRPANIAGIHLFPLGGLAAATNYLADKTGSHLHTH